MSQDLDLEALKRLGQVLKREAAQDVIKSKKPEPVKVPAPVTPVKEAPKGPFGI